MKILVTGASGFLGKRVCKKLDEKNLNYSGTSLSMGVDLRDKKQTFKFFERIKPDYVLNCASYVGGIQYGYKYPVELFHNNLLMNVILLEAIREFKIERLVNPISNCVYPADATLFKEKEMWNGAMHESVHVYGFVRKSLIIGAWAYHQQYELDIINIILSNMYGPEDHFEEERSHALGALIMKFVKAKEKNEPFVSIWGSGKPVREWLHVDDGAEAMIRSIYIEKHIEPINIGMAQGISVYDLARMIRKYVQYEGEIRLDPTRPDGAAFKTVDGSKGEKILSWKPQIDFEQGVKDTILWYIQNQDNYGD